MEKINYLGYTIDIDYDDNSYDPRSDSNLGTMICNHGRYTLGDKKLESYGESFLDDLLHELYPDEYDLLIEMEGVQSLLTKLDKEYIYMPLRLYDHSGISISTGGHQSHDVTSGWDSGMVGYIYCSIEKLKEELILLEGETYESKGYSILEYEVKYYNKYLNGDFYRYDILLLDEMGGGFDSEEEAIKEAKSIIDSRDPEGKLYSKAKKLAEDGYDNFWDFINNNTDEEDDNRELIHTIVGELIRKY